MTDTEKNITNQLKSAIAISDMNYSSFNKNRKLISRVVNKGVGTIGTLCSMCDDMGVDIVLMKR